MEAPELNPEIVPSLNESSQKRDKHFLLTQNLAGSGLSALGMAITATLKDEEEPVDRLKLLEWLCDAGKCFVEVHHAQSRARAAYILPGVSKPMRDALEKTKPDSFLFGKNLGEKIKEVKAMEKLTKDLKPKPSGTSYKKTPLRPTRALNWRGPIPVTSGSTADGQQRENISPHHIPNEEAEHPNPTLVEPDSATDTESRATSEILEVTKIGGRL